MPCVCLTPVLKPVVAQAVGLCALGRASLEYQLLRWRKGPPPDQAGADDGALAACGWRFPVVLLCIHCALAVYPRLGMVWLATVYHALARSARGPSMTTDCTGHRLRPGSFQAKKR